MRSIVHSSATGPRGSPLAQSMYERLAKQQAALPTVVSIESPIDDIDRIMALPRRPPVDCTRDKITGRYPAATQALVEHVTGWFSRGPRLSCGCRPRKITRVATGLVIDRPPFDGSTQIVCSEEAFVADNHFSKEELELVRRVCEMPCGESLDVPAADGTSDGRPCIEELSAPQAWMLYEAKQADGLVALAGVGCGKTVVWLLAPLLFSDTRLAVLSIKPKQRLHYVSHYLRLREHFRVPSIVHDHGAGKHDATVPGTPPLRIVCYSTISDTRQSKILDELRPDLLLLDEGHAACGDSAVNRRFRRYFRDRVRTRAEALARGEEVSARSVRLLVGSGTLEPKSVADTQMVCAYALGAGSPLPLDPSAAIAMTAVMDGSRRPDRTSSMAKRLRRVWGDGKTTTVSASGVEGLMEPPPEPAIREGFRRWRQHTRGVVIAATDDVGASLYLVERRISAAVPQAVRDALEKVRMWERPDGEELVEKIEQVACARNVACGFYPYWAFPTHPCTCGGEAPRCSECMLIEDWYRKRKAYRKDERSQVQRGEENLDSSKLCRDAAVRYWQELSGEPVDDATLPRWQCTTYPEWRDIENKVRYEERVRWIDDFVARKAAEWGQKHKGVIWFRSTPLGRKIEELSGLPYFNGGLGCEARLKAERGDRAIICSIKALGAGTDDLQYKFSDQYVTEPPASCGGEEGWEQLLGRLHRRGQAADRVRTWVNVHSAELSDALRQAEREAQWSIEMGSSQMPKLLMCDRAVEEL